MTQTLTRLPPPKNQSLQGEIWLPVVGHEKHYRISNFGRVISLNRHVRRVNWSGRITTYHIKERLMRLSVAANGYLVVNLTLTRESKVYYIHRLVALAFIPNPDNKPEVNHKDGNKSNAHVDNLEWVTTKENLHHSFRELNRKGGRLGKKGALSKNSKKVRLIKPNGESEIHDSILGACEKYNLSNGNAGSVLKGRRKHTKGYKFQLI